LFFWEARCDINSFFYAPYKNPNNPFQINCPKCIFWIPNEKSIINTMRAIIKEAIETTIALF
jgi:hypothetical protein